MIKGKYYNLEDSDFHTHLESVLSMLLHRCYENGSSEAHISLYVDDGDESNFTIFIFCNENKFVNIQLHESHGNFSPIQLTELVKLNWLIKSSNGTRTRHLDFSSSQKHFVSEFIEVFLQTLYILEISRLKKF